MTPTKVGIILIFISLTIAVLMFQSLERKAAEVVEAIPSAGVVDQSSIDLRTQVPFEDVTDNPTLAD